MCIVNIVKNEEINGIQLSNYACMFQFFFKIVRDQNDMIMREREREREREYAQK